MKVDEAETLTNPKNIKKLLDLFADATGCEAQYGGCPCNSCFHAIDDKVDFRHITWLILLGIRGDYTAKDVLPNIKKELKEA